MQMNAGLAVGHRARCMQVAARGDASHQPIVLVLGGDCSVVCFAWVVCQVTESAKQATHPRRLCVQVHGGAVC
jgi:hypothetical protein